MENETEHDVAAKASDVLDELCTKPVPVTVKGLGKKLLVRKFRVDQKLALAKLLTGGQKITSTFKAEDLEIPLDNLNEISRLKVLFGFCKPDGTDLFTLAQVNAIDGDKLADLVEAVNVVNREEAESVANAKKNSKATTH